MINWEGRTALAGLADLEFDLAQFKILVSLSDGVYANFLWNFLKLLLVCNVKSDH